MNGPMRNKGPSHQGSKAKTSGWAAYTLQQRQQQGGWGSDADVDPFPSLISSSSCPTGLISKGSGWGCVRDNHKIADMTTVSCKDINFVCIGCRYADTVESERLGDTCTSISVEPNQRGTDELNKNQVKVEKLKGLYAWADLSLIEDILRAVDYDLEQADVSLASMVEEKQDEIDNFEISEISEALGKVTTEEGSGSLKSVAVASIGGFMPTAPPEPEWEEDDDVYWKHRKDGLRMSRVAGRHSKNAQNAYFRGDHHTARMMSKKSQQEYMAAKKLNSKAAEEILLSRNGKINVWKLDLHGLHVSEAMDALASRLEMIKYNVPKDSSALSGAKKSQEGNRNPEDQTSTGVLSVMPRPSELQVITGAGVHSRGGAALPMAIKNFLIGEGYKFSEARAGVIAVRPKFRYS